MMDTTGGASKALGAVLFIQASTMAMDVYSALNSSPWTAESFGGDPEKAKSCREYVYWSIGFTTAFGVAAAVIAGSLWPIIGTFFADAFMWWIYNRALMRAVTRGSTSWEGSTAAAA